VIKTTAVATIEYIEIKKMIKIRKKLSYKKYLERKSESENMH